MPTATTPRGASISTSPPIRASSTGSLEAFRAGFEGVAFGKPAIPMVSSMRGTWGADDDFASADYWVRHLRQTVRFTDAVAAALAQPDRIVIEVGPGQTLGPLVDLAPVAHRPLAILPSAPRPRDIENEMGVIAAAFGGLWANGYPVDWDRLNGPEGRRVSLPTYPFEKERHWIEPGRGAEALAADAPLALTRIADPADWVEELGWELSPRAGAAPDLRGSWLVFAGDDALSAAVLEHLSQAQANVTVIRAAEAFAQGPDGFALRPDAPEDYERLGAPLIPCHGASCRFGRWPPGLAVRRSTPPIFWRGWCRKPRPHPARIWLSPRPALPVSRAKP